MGVIGLIFKDIRRDFLPLFVLLLLLLFLLLLLLIVLVLLLLLVLGLLVLSGEGVKRKTEDAGEVGIDLVGVNND